jgi:hypothetical protein
MDQKGKNIVYDAFISYRRKGGSEKAQLIKSELRQRGIPDERIFLDTHSLHEGNFEEKIRKAISESQNIIVIISQGCFDEVRQTDYWYLEIREALNQGKNIIPVLFDNISSFTNLNVPDNISSLKEKNCVSYQHEYANAAFDKLYTFLGLGVKNPIPHRGILMRYKGCMFSIMLAFIGLVVLVPLGLSVFNNDDPKNPSDIIAKKNTTLDNDSNNGIPNKAIINMESDNNDKQLVSASEPNKANSRKSASSSSTNPTNDYQLPWAKYNGGLSNNKPEGVGELYITKHHYLDDIQVSPGETIKGRFSNGKIVIAVLRKNDGTTITLREITLTEK